MKYTVKTVYRTSAGHYSSTATEPLAGTGQSGASPAVCLSICAVLLLAYKTQAPKGMTFSDPTVALVYGPSTLGELNLVGIRIKQGIKRRKIEVDGYLTMIHPA